MLNQKTVLPNFVKTNLFIAAVALSLSVFAEETPQTIAEEAAQMKDETVQSFSLPTDTGTEEIGDLHDMKMDLEEEVETEETDDVVGE